MKTDHKLQRAYIAPLSGFGYNDVCSGQDINASHQGTQLIVSYREWHQATFPSAHRMEWDKQWEAELYQRSFLLRIKNKT